MFILINNNLNILLLKKNNLKFLIIYTKYYYTKYLLNDDINIYFNKNCNTLDLKHKMPLIKFFNINESMAIQNFQITGYFYKKIFFSGKSYKIKKTNNNFLLEFNKSHPEVIT